MPEHTPKQSGHRAGLRIERIVIDECFGPDSPLLAQLTGRLCGHPVERVFLAARHPGIPDVEILDKLLDGRTALLTHDRALHNLTIDRGFRSFVQSPDGSLPVASYMKSPLATKAFRRREAVCATATCMRGRVTHKSSPGAFLGCCPNIS